jgi:hypothetical protein
MIGMQFTGVCPKCREKFGLTLDGGSIVSESWRTFYRCYEEHYDAAHVDSWQKLARDAVRSYRPDGPRLVNAAVLESRLEKLEAANANR